MRQNNRFSSFAAFCLGIAAILLLIQAGGALHGNRIVFPDVREIGEALIRLLSRGETYIRIGVTMMHLLAALAVSMTAGVLAGVAEGLSEKVYSFLKPLMILIRALPMIILVILVMTVLPYDRVPVITCVLALLPVISEAVCEGCRSIEPELLDVYRLNSGFSVQVLFHVYIPSIAGYLKQAFFNAAGMGLRSWFPRNILYRQNSPWGKRCIQAAISWSMLRYTHMR